MTGLIPIQEKILMQAYEKVQDSNRCEKLFVCDVRQLNF